MHRSRKRQSNDASHGQAPSRVHHVPSAQSPDARRRPGPTSGVGDPEDSQGGTGCLKPPRCCRRCIWSLLTSRGTWNTLQTCVELQNSGLASTWQCDFACEVQYCSELRTLDGPRTFALGFHSRGAKGRRLETKIRASVVALDWYGRGGEALVEDRITNPSRS